jgi:hypothetical protein
MAREKKTEIPTRFTLNLDYESAKMLLDLCSWEGRKKNSMLMLLIKREYSTKKNKK